MSKVNFEKNPVLPINKFTSLILPRNAMWLQHLIIQFTLSLFLLSGHLRDVKNKKKFKLSAPKVVAVVYKRWSLTRGDLTWKLLVFWKTGH